MRTAMDLFDRMDMVLVGIGAVEPSRLLASSGNVFSSQELNQMRKHGAVGLLWIGGNPQMSLRHCRKFQAASNRA